VVGAGPGGSLAAKTCAEEGLKVALLEKHAKPGQKLCGGGLSAKVLRDFDIDSRIIECTIRESRIFYSKESVTTKHSEEEATVYRDKFDNYLANQAVESGAKIFASTCAKELLRDSGEIVGVAAKSPKGLVKIKGKIIIAADGFYSSIVRSSGLMPNYHSSDIALTVQREARTQRELHDDCIRVFIGKEISPCGYGWVYPKRYGYTIGVGSLVSHLKGRLTGYLDYLIQRHPIASKILSDCTEMSATKAACIPMLPHAKICADHIMAVGDAAGQVDAIGGSGIYFAMKAGELAGRVAKDAVINEDFSRQGLISYEDKWERMHGRWLKRRRRILEQNADRLEEYMYSNTRFQMSLARNPVLRGAYLLSRRLFRSLIM
jgi:digeranylgeranylglycerophospholipid reductase